MKSIYIDSSHHLPNILPKVIWLEAEHFEFAQAISNQYSGEVHRWKVYLNALALIGFEQWLKERIPDNNIIINRDNCSILKADNYHVIDVVFNLKLGEFSLCLITVDNLIDDSVNVPVEVIISSQFVSHFYVLLEVLEEEEQLKIQGFLSSSELNKYRQIVDLSKLDGEYKIPIDCFDREVNNLLLYTRFLEPTAILSPAVTQTNNTIRQTQTLTQAKNTIDKTFVNLSQWWSQVFEETWQSTEVIWNAIPSNSTFGYVRSRNQTNNYSLSRTKLFDFGLILQNQSLALIVNLKQQDSQEIDVLVQVLPHQKEILPTGLKLKVILNPNTLESVNQEVITRNNDNAIQLEFSETPGKQFQVEVSFQDAVVTEDFVL